MCLCPALAPATDKYETKYMIANVLYMSRMNAHKFLSQKEKKKKEDDLSTKSVVCFCKVVFLHILGSQEEDYVSPLPPPPLPRGRGRGEEGEDGERGKKRKYCTVLYCTVPYCTVLYYIVLYYNSTLLLVLWISIKL